ncbi:MAG TPA: HD domain-containing protein [Chloroflexi bacterium]|nr:HD domain-containing protein [Chloroflexota bacterium]
MIKKICLDWGNTLCHVTGEYDGPMIDWLEIRLIDGARESVGWMTNKYGPLSVATNAKDSSLEQVLAVMDRMNLSSSFGHIFLPSEIGYGKDDVGYYRNIANELGEEPGGLLMIGDDYQLDVVNAWRAGWQTALFVSGEGYSFRPMPLQQFEAKTWPLLVDQLSAPRPTLQECFAWLQEGHQTFILLHHVQLVAAIAYWLAHHLMLAGEAVDPILAHRAALLHDLDKLVPGRPAEMHGIWGAEEIANRGFEKVAEIVQQHVPVNPETIRFTTREAELVFFADKMAKGNQMVSIKERYDDLVNRYPALSNDRNAIEDILYGTQKDICATLAIESEDLLGTIRTALGFW